MFPDWTIAAAGSVKIGYEYGWMVTGEDLQIELNEEQDNEIDPQE